MTGIPSNWPPDVRYIENCTIHSSVPPETRNFLAVKATCTSHTPSLVKIRRISEPTHPACGQLGLFAARIPAKTHIVDYIGTSHAHPRRGPTLDLPGEIHCDEREDSDYDLALYRDGEGDCVGIDASKMGNEGRFVNDYRGIPGQEKANAVFVEVRTAGGLKMTISSCREIKKGQEILVSYGKSWWNARM